MKSLAEFCLSLFTLVLPVIVFAQNDPAKKIRVNPARIQEQDPEKKKIAEPQDTKIIMLQNAIPDSIQTVTANDVDFADFKNSVMRVSDYLRNNPDCEGNVYIDSSADFNLILQVIAYCRNAPKICMIELTYNMRLMENVISKSHLDDKDVETIRMILNNNAEVIGYLKFTKTANNTFVPSRQLSIKIIDSNGSVVNNTTCYLLTRKKCRDCSCITCREDFLNCKQDLVKILEDNRDYKFDMVNNESFKVPCGFYNVFVVKDDKISKYSKEEIEGGNIYNEDKELVLQLNEHE